MNKVFVSPHNDDETLFGAFTIMLEKPSVVVVYDSYVQPARGYLGASAEVRRMETVKALLAMGLTDEPIFLGLRDDEVDPEKVSRALEPFIAQADRLWFPAVETRGGNRHHDLVGRFALKRLGGRSCTYYSTYNQEEKSIGPRVVQPTTDMVIAKYRALSCYRSQLDVPDCRPHFLRSQEEYYQL